MKRSDAEKQPQGASSDTGNDKTALLAGILGIKPGRSPANATASPQHAHVPPQNAHVPPTLGMPMFFSGPPPSASPLGQPSGPPGKSDDHMSRLLGMLNTSGSPATTPAQAFISPNLPTQRPNTPPAPAPVAGPAARESRFFGRQSTAPSAVQSPVQSPNQPRQRVADSRTAEARAAEPRGDSDQTNRNPGQQAPTSARDGPPGLHATRSSDAQPPQPPSGMFPPGPMMGPPFAQGQPMQPPGMQMGRPHPTSPLEHDAARQGMFPPSNSAMPPPFWQQGPPPPFGMMQMPPPPGYMQQQGFPLPPGAMPPPQGAPMMMSPHHPHMSPAFSAMYPSTAGGPGPPLASPLPGGPYGMPMPHMQPFPGARPAGYPPFPPGMSSGQPPQHQQQQQMTHDLMSLLGSMQAKTG